MIFLHAREITKRFQSEIVLRGVTLEVTRGETLSILGRSGCGKTTLLKILAGLVEPESGAVLLEGVDITRTVPQERNILYLYQEPLLFPHLDVWENIVFGLRLRHYSPVRISEVAEPLLEELELSGMRHKMPDQLSGGQRQRVAFGRAMAVQPSLLLLDEPFSSLDTGTRANMQALFKRTAARHQVTAIFVTHSLKEAMLMGDNIARMEQGVLTSYASRDDFVRDPASGVPEEIAFWQSLRRES